MKVQDILEVKNTVIINGDKNARINHFSISTNDIKGKTIFIPLKGNTDGHDYILNGVKGGIAGFFVEENHQDIIKKALKINKDLIIIEVKNSLKALQELALKTRAKLNVPVIALTGSFGKTSQREMILSVLKQKFKVLSTTGNYNNHIGMPLTLVNYKKEDIILLELGTNHMGEIAFLRDICKPTITLITNIGTAHIGNFKNLNNTFKEKTSITLGSNYFLRNLDDERIKKFKPKNVQIIDYGLHDADISNIIYGKKNRYTVTLNGKSYKVTLNSNIDYLINYSICAMKLGLLLDMNMKDIITGIKEFEGAKGRMHRIEMGKTVIIDDCYNASYETMINGLEYFNKESCPHKIVVLGDILELGRKSKQIHKDIASYIIKNNLTFEQFHLVGPKMYTVYKMLKAKKYNVFYYKAVDDIDTNIFNDKSIYLKSSHGTGLYKLIPDKSAH